MSAITFELKKEHILLLKNLRWSVNKNNIICNELKEGLSFGGCGWCS